MHRVNRLRRGETLRILRKFHDASYKTSYWNCSISLNQGPDGACGGFALAHIISTEPLSVEGITFNTAMNLFHRAREIHGRRRSYRGTTGIAIARVGVEHGWYKDFAWAFTASDLAWAVGQCGPAILIVPWYAEMSTPDEHGFISPKGEQYGSHILVCNGYNHETKSYRLHNSWGPLWGINGHAYITEESMATLLSVRGEACIPTKHDLGLGCPLDR